MRVLLLTTLMATGAQVGCVQFNECDVERGARLGAAAIDLDIRENIVRTQETAIGNMVADAILATGRAVCTDGGSAPCPDFALQNSGGLREETACGSRETIEAGNIFESDVRDLLPFENEIVVVRLTGADVRLGLERAVSQVGQIGEAAAVGYFLSVSGLSFDVSCAGTSQTVDPEGRAILNRGTRVSNILINDPNGDPYPLDDEAEYEVIMNAYIASGNDGFLAFLLRDNLEVVFGDDGEPIAKMNAEQDRVLTSSGTQVTDQNAAVAYIEASDRAGIAVGRPAEGRIRIAPDCFALEP